MTKTITPERIYAELPGLVAMTIQEDARIYANDRSASGIRGSNAYTHAMFALGLAGVPRDVRYDVFQVAVENVVVA